jgi:ubiquinone/menaquinone biosynthesis C-methylase UbiE
MQKGKIKNHFEKQSEISKFRFQKGFDDREDFTQFSRNRVATSMIERLEVEIILDIGCGSGGYLHVKQDEGTKYVGIDISEGMLMSAEKQANQIDRNQQTSFLVGDAVSLPFDSDTFEAVLAIGLIEYYSDPEPLLQEVARVLEPEGVLILQSAAPWPYFNKIWNVLRPIKNRYTGDQIRHYQRTKQETDKIVNNIGFKLTDWAFADFHFLPLPFNLLLFPIHVKISEAVSNLNNRRFGYFAVNYISQYRLRGDFKKETRDDT